MAKNIADVDVLTDTFNTWVLRTNEIITTLNTEVLTANSTQGITGSSGSPRNAKLFGTFEATTLGANTLTVGLGSFIANSSMVVLGNVPIVAGGGPGTAGQVLTSNGTAVYWSTVTGGGGGGVSSLTAGSGIQFNTGSTITSSGTISVKAADTSISVSAAGISVNTAFITGGLTNATTLQGRTWEAPGTIGSSIANTGTFTTVTATNYRITGDTVFLINNSVIRTQGNLDVTTPNSGTTGGVRIRGNSTTNLAYLQITNSLGSAEWSNFQFNSAGRALYSGSLEVLQDFRFNGTATFGSGTFAGTEVGYKTIPQIVTNSNVTIDPTVSSGAHHYKTTTSSINLTIPSNTTAPCPIGTAITVVNDASTGNVNLLQGSGVTLQLGGTLTTGNLVVGPGGVATILKVQTNKWIASGTGVS